MSVERRGAGRWRRDAHDDGSTTGGSVRKDYTYRKDPGPAVLGRTDGLDRADVGSPPKGGQRRQVVQPDRQGSSRTNSESRLLSSGGERRSRRGGSRHDLDV